MTHHEVKLVLKRARELRMGDVWRHEHDAQCSWPIGWARVLERKEGPGPLAILSTQHEHYEPGVTTVSWQPGPWDLVEIQSRST